MRIAGAPRLRRLENRSDFLKAARARKAATPGLVLQARTRDAGETPDDPDPRIGFTASKKVGGSVVRNRARRRLRAAVNDVLAAIAKPDHDYVLIARAETVRRSYDDLLADLRQAVARVEKGGDRPRRRR